MKDTYQYLVVLRHAMDDLPLQFCDTMGLAVEVAEATEAEPTEFIRDVYGVDADSPCNVSVVTFCNGRAVKSEIVKTF